ncbi:hypothetical protein MRB53_023360 [Persea americana]|uniref:Uncharacterized protein n=1 Tax=Persea americana TaxID=3435 RepID=A0ACC2L9J4_PERAE|nr:hypothetical protein MRB53_023360 [Persea americana]
MLLPFSLWIMKGHTLQGPNLISLYLVLVLAHSLHRHCLRFWGPLGNHLLSLHLFSDRCDSSKTHMLDGGLDHPLIDRTIRFINKFSVFGLLALIPFGSSKNHKLKSFTFRSFKFKFLWMMERSTDGGKESVMMLI